MSVDQNSAGQNDGWASAVRQRRVLVTGAGGPAAVAFMASVAAVGAELAAVDIDPYAAGLYHVGADRRALVPRGDDPGFVDALLELCRRWSIEAVVPTVDTELLPVARRLDEFAAVGAVVVGHGASTLELCLDKWTLVETCRDLVDVPATVVVDGSGDALAGVGLPAIAKPRQGSGSRGVRVIADRAELVAVPDDGSYLVQELLPGREYSIDVLAYRDGTVVAAVPRSRLKTDSGIAVTGAVDVDPVLIDYGRRVATAIGCTSVANVQVMLDADGAPRLIEVNPRFPGSMPLTVAAGVDMPALALADALGADVPTEFALRPLAMVRSWTESFFAPGEFLDASADRRGGG